MFVSRTHNSFGCRLATITCSCSRRRRCRRRRRRRGHCYPLRPRRSTIIYLCAKKGDLLIVSAPRIARTYTFIYVRFILLCRFVLLSRVCCDNFYEISHTQYNYIYIHIGIFVDRPNHILESRCVVSARHSSYYTVIVCQHVNFSDCFRVRHHYRSVRVLSSWACQTDAVLFR